MLEICNINKMYPTLYKGRPYTLIEAKAKVDDAPEEVTVTFASDELMHKILYTDGSPKGPDEKILNEEIYGYFPQEILKRPEKEVIEWLENNIN